MMAEKPKTLLYSVSVVLMVMLLNQKSDRSQALLIEPLERLVAGR